MLLDIKDCKFKQKMFESIIFIKKELLIQKGAAYFFQEALLFELCN